MNQTTSKLLQAVAIAVLSPGVLAAMALAAGTLLAVAGVRVLLGDGAALLTGAVPLLLLGIILLRGVLRHGR